MTLKAIHLELARNKDFPEGSRDHGYDFRAPLSDDGSLDHDAWQSVRKKCTVRRFWNGEADETGHLVHHAARGGGRWLFHYDGEDADMDEPIFKFDRHHFLVGEYVTITEHDGEARTFRVTDVRDVA